MKQLLFLVVALGLFSCNQQAGRISILQNRVDNLEAKLADTYKPGFGELMTGIQSHHAKLWFAGENENWRLAAFEVKELNEIIADILKYQAEREESKYMEIIYPAMDSVGLAINQKNLGLFKRSYTSLTIACNNCHLTTDFEYNVVRVPEYSSFSNQDFKSKN